MPCHSGSRGWRFKYPLNLVGAASAEIKLVHMKREDNGRVTQRVKTKGVLDERIVGHHINSVRCNLALPINNRRVDVYVVWFSGVQELLCTFWKLSYQSEANLVV